MKGFMVYAWNAPYPDIAERQVKGVFLDENMAKALVVELEEAGNYTHVQKAEIDIVE